MDGSYHHVVADGIKAGGGSFTTPPDGTDEVHFLRMKVAEHLFAQRSPTPNTVTLPTQPLCLLFDPPNGLLESFRPNWDSVWQVLATEEWSTSVEELRQALAKSPGCAEDAMSRHIELLGKKFRDSFEFSRTKNKESCIWQITKKVARDVFVQLVFLTLDLDMPGSSTLTTESYDESRKWVAKGELTRLLRRTVMLQ